MLDYELAKQLKDKGWPQTFKEGASYYDKSGKFCESACSEYNHDLDWDTAVPTLEELIEATPKLSTLRRTGMEADGTWACDTVDYPDVYGATPSIAVARLWLALHPLP